MNKTTINVPKGIKFLLDWNEFNLPEYPIILNKQITGCGFTEWCIRNDKNIILCSPRRILLENKTEQHPYKVLYLNNSLEHPIVVDEDLNKPYKSSSVKHKELTKEQKLKAQETISEMKDVLMGHYFNHSTSRLPCKILVTYDSFRHVKEALGYRIKDFYVVIDEFQSIFTDSRFKSDTELEFINHLRDIQNLCFVSATPMIDKYLKQLLIFKDLPYYELDWETENPGRVLRPDLKPRIIRSVIEQALLIINSYKSGNFETALDIGPDGKIKEVVSKEAVIYVNSVKNIVSIIKKSGLLPNEVNILCANTPENQIKLNKIAGKGVYEIGKVPLMGEYHKMITLCTRTVYLGADFYSTCARSFILSDANIDTLAVDITLDLPQILGRQRLKENPWKNRAELYFKSITKKNIVTEEDFQIYIENKLRKTESLLRSYKNALDSDKHDLAENFQKVAKSYNYRDDYVSVNTHGGKDLYPVKNELVIISEKRAFDIQQIDYADRFTVFNKLVDVGLVSNSLRKFVKEFDELPGFYDKMKALCESNFSENEKLIILEQVPILYKNLYLQLGPERLKANSYNITFVKRELLNNETINANDVREEIINRFLVSGRYLLSEIKEILKDIYMNFNIFSTPKASDLENYFEVKKIQITNKVTGKKDHGYEILKMK